MGGTLTDPPVLAHCCYSVTVEPLSQVHLLRIRRREVIFEIVCFLFFVGFFLSWCVG